ncbi:hypothetical protein BHE74_00044789 [Ensete ventricosum]|nr:hypothetical protein BHE74_00044789 [Ensete ventricosum]RZS09829.1 hypothetical protein BHM03_00040968 [Ensete ventricosum]
MGAIPLCFSVLCRLNRRILRNHVGVLWPPLSLHVPCGVNSLATPARFPGLPIKDLRVKNTYRDSTKYQEHPRPTSPAAKDRIGHFIAVISSTPACA